MSHLGAVLQTFSDTLVYFTRELCQQRIWKLSLRQAVVHLHTFLGLKTLVTFVQVATLCYIPKHLICSGT
jgi:hypothetical protein